MATLSDRITTDFTAASTATDVVQGVDLDGAAAVVTGGAGGIGLATVHALARAGADVLIATRDAEAGARAAAEAEAAGGRVGAARLDLADPDSIAAFADAWDGPLPLLVANAGVVTSGLERTARGWELQLAVNLLGHFDLAVRLRGALAAGAAERGGARVVVLSSTAHMRAGVDFDDLQFERRPYDPQVAYAQSKTADSLLAVELSRRFADDGIVANAVNPGGIRTGLQRNFSDRQRESLAAAEAAGAFAWKTPDQGAATTLVAAVHPAFARTGGHYLDDCQEAVTVPDDATLLDAPHGVKAWALDPASAERLWDVSARLVGA